jgi:probable DNA repair protein
VKPELQAALASGAVAVTANRRQARALQREFAATAMAGGARSWATPSILSYDAWLQTLWLDLLAAPGVASLPRLLSPAQSGYCWQRIVGADTARSAPLIDARGAATLAAEAWALLHRWGAGGESWRGWPQLSLSDDQAAFVSWAESYAAALAATGSVDGALLPDLLARSASGLMQGRTLDLHLSGFAEETPQQLRLLNALIAAGARVTRIDPLPSAAGVAQRVTATTTADELSRAFAWARGELAARTGARVAVAVADLSARRDEAVALAEDAFCPALQWPGRELEGRPFNISLGGRLAEAPLVGAALELIALGLGTLPVERAAAALRSAYVVGAQTMWPRRARLERSWLEEGRREIGLNETLAALPSVDSALADRWRAASAAQRLPAAASPREWVEAWRDWLTALGWPGDRSLSSAEYQTREGWDELLRDFGAIGAVEVRLARADALSLLRSLAAEKIHQAETADAPVQILGLLEAQGQTFDALWVAGLGAARWPPAPEPNPFLPIEWQRERELPRSSAARELRFARELMARLRRGAPSVMLSYVRGSDEAVDAPSALILDVPEASDGALPAPIATAKSMFAERPALEAVADDAAPPLAPGARARGGAGLVAKQSDCPFRAMAIHRLRVDCWPRPIEGVSAAEHGLLVHETMAVFWRRLGDQASMLRLAPRELDERIRGAVAQASADALPAFRWRVMPPLVAEIERDRVAQIVRRWLETQEHGRPPFRLLEAELKLPLEIGGLLIELRIDRVDALEGGGIAIIDYKTGKTVTPARWFDERPQAPQIGLYALAWQDARDSQPLRAAAYAQLRRGELEVMGLAADAAAWPALKQPDQVKGPDLRNWADVEARWRRSLSALAGEVLNGHSAVTPRKPSETCRSCGLQPLCRIGARGLMGKDDDGVEAFDED